MRNVIGFICAVAFSTVAAVTILVVALALSPLVLAAFVVRKVRRGR